MARDRVDRIAAEWVRERPDLDVAPQRVIGRVHRLALALTDELLPVYARFGLGEGEFDVLCALRRAGEPYARRPAELARATMITTGGLTKRLDRLVARGLVSRDREGGTDRRAKVVALTPAGRELIDRAFAAHIANEHRLVAAVSPRDRASLERILRAWILALGEEPEADDA